MKTLNIKRSIHIGKFKLKYNVFIFSFIIFIISFGLSLFLVKYTTPKTIFSLVGDKKKILAVNEEYKDEGIKLIKNGKEVSLSGNNVTYTVASNIDSKKIGKYKLIYNIKYNKKDYKLIRTILVEDHEKPVLKADVDKLVLYPCTTIDKLKVTYTASDNYDGDITDKVERKNRKNKIILSVLDSSDNETILEIPVEAKNEPNPTINLVGGNESLLIGTSYSEKGAIAVDACGNDISKNITISGSVDSNTIGTYELSYSVKTASDLETTVTRTINVVESTFEDHGNKVVYLTFDDGPGSHTEELLDILKKYNVKATFFVTAQFSKYVPLIQREAAEGHTVAVHTKTHQWSIYGSLEDYMNDFNAMNDIIEQYTGKRSTIFRFPGGSSNTKSCGANSKATLPQVVDKTKELGYTYFDWNVDSGDAAGASSEKIKNNIINGVRNRNNSVVLCHDIKVNTINIIEEYLQFATANGYIFKAIDETTPVVHHGINRCHYK